MERPGPWLRREWREFAGALLDLILPPACPACDQPGSGLCGPCRRNLAVRGRDGCARCGEPLAPDGRCRADHRALRNLRALHAPLQFAGSGGRLVRRFKLDAHAGAGQWLARAMADACRGRAGLDRRAILVPVPLHRARLRRRGFDQAAWLAREVGLRLDLPVWRGLLVRQRATLPQGDARVLSRVENVRGAFALRRADRVQGRSVVLLDDVFTTGATARACASLLLAAGAHSVTMLAACRS